MTLGVMEQQRGRMVWGSIYRARVLGMPEKGVNRKVHDHVEVGVSLMRGAI